MQPHTALAVQPLGNVGRIRAGLQLEPQHTLRHEFPKVQFLDFLFFAVDWADGRKV